MTAIARFSFNRCRIFWWDGVQLRFVSLSTYVYNVCYTVRHFVQSIENRTERREQLLIKNPRSIIVMSRDKQKALEGDQMNQKTVRDAATGQQH